jgi:hypothetical protein
MPARHSAIDPRRFQAFAQDRGMPDDSKRGSVERNMFEQPGTRMCGRVRYLNDSQVGKWPQSCRLRRWQLGDDRARKVMTCPPDLQCRMWIYSNDMGAGQYCVRGDPESRAAAGKFAISGNVYLHDALSRQLPERQQ